jgi:C1A family cysteine protease
MKRNTNENIINNTGALFSPIDIRDYRLACVGNESEFPEEFELKMPKVKQQSLVSSCVAHSIATTIEYFNMIQNNDDTTMSTNYIYGNRTGMFYNSKGMYTRKAIANTCKYGDVYERDFPGNTEVPKVIKEFEDKKYSLYDKGIQHRFSSYYSVKGKNEIKTALMQNGPVIFAMSWYDDIKVKNGIIQTNYKGNVGGHCMVIYGWNKDGWKIQNSWGKIWGNKGRAVLPYDIKIKEAYGITDNIIGENDIIKPYNSAFGQFFAKIANWILNLIKR